MLQRLGTVIRARATDLPSGFNISTAGRLGLWAALLVLLSVIIRTAWMCDDAFISMRTVDSFVSGNGLRWNPDERVQAFTHPLWVLLVAIPYAVTRDPYFSVMALSILLSTAAAAVLAAGIARPGWNAFAALGLLICSKAFVDFSTSGLENPLSCFLLSLVLLWTWREPADLPKASLAAGLLVVNRLDLAVLVAPVVLWARHGGRLHMLRTMGLFALPIAGWMAFSLIYYGFPFPNTAYAKLSTGIPRDELFRQGMMYVRESVTSDPLTLAASAAAIVLAFAQPTTRPAAMGLAGYLAYVVSIGGDFMSGRFFAVPLFVAAAVVARFARLGGAWRGPLVTASIVALGLAGAAPPILTDGTYSRAEMPAHGIADERGIYYRETGLLRQGGEWQSPKVELAEKYRAAIERGRRAITSDFIGVQGYLAGDRINIIDFLALADPMLARLPAERPWRVGHYPRTMPEGYFDSVQYDENRVVDPDLRAYYEELRRLTRDPIWSGSRFRSILLMNTGYFDHLVERYVARTRAARGL